MSVPGLSLLGLKCIRGSISVLCSINPSTIIFAKGHELQEYLTVNKQ